MVQIRRYVVGRAQIRYYLQAGLIDVEDSSQLILALEPEAASLHCKSLKMNNFIDYAAEHYPEDLYMPAGTVYALVDAGGRKLLYIPLKGISRAI